MKKKILSFCLFVILIISAVFVFSACGGGTAQKLEAPVVTLNENVANWDANEKAEKFEISLDGELSFLENVVTSKKLKEGQTFKIRAIGDGTTYLNSDWSNVVTCAGATTFTITWKNGDSILEKDEGVAFGEMPTYDGATPQKESTAFCNYTFCGWDPEIVEATESITYYAQFIESVREYKVTLNANGGKLEQKSISVAYNSVYGELPVPTRADYAFAGWKLGEEIVTAETKMTSTQDHALVAEWVAVKAYVTYNNNISISPSSNKSETIEIPLDIAKLKELGYTEIEVSATVHIKEKDDGYQQVWINANGGQVYHNEFNHSGVIDDVVKGFSFSIYLSDLLINSNGNAVFTAIWGVKDSMFGDDWVKGTTTWNVVAVK